MYMYVIIDRSLKKIGEKIMKRIAKPYTKKENNFSLFNPHFLKWVKLQFCYMYVLINAILSSANQSICFNYFLMITYKNRKKKTIMHLLHRSLCGFLKRRNDIFVANKYNVVMTKLAHWIISSWCNWSMFYKSVQSVHATFHLKYKNITWNLWA